MVLSGIPDLSRLPPSSRLQTGSGATLAVDLENRPCNLPARTIDEVSPGLGKRFRAAAANRRWVAAWVERPGTLRVGDRMRLHLPTRRPWSGA